MNKSGKIFVAGATGMVGSAIIRQLGKTGFSNIVGNYHSRKPMQAGDVRYFPLDLTDQKAVREFFETERPDYIFLAAAKVGGISANDTYRAQFIYENLQIQNNVIHQSYLSGVEKLLFLGSSCIYPKLCPQPMKEEYLLTGELEPTNEPYAIAKIAGIKMCEAYRDQYGCNFISVMPTNLYGPNDNYNLNTSHVFPALIRKFHEAVMEDKDSVEIWGSGNPKREFMHVDDLAAATIFLMENYNNKSFVNIGWGEDVSIRELAMLIKEVSGFRGELIFDPTKPDGTPRKLLDTARLRNLGFNPSIPLKKGIEMVYKDFKHNYGTLI
ncbi:MAG: GDP-L-fucose synthase [Bacteroidetes bacterium]|nr:GDP-L-fucose synthase [Bacteroidota bacterium]